MELSIIIPIYNESGNIKLLHERLTKAISPMKVSYEMIFVNDGSRDDSMALIKQLASSHPEVKFIDLSRNFGHQIAVTAGLQFCNGDSAVIIDADLQEDPADIVRLMGHLRSSDLAVDYDRANWR